MSQRSFFRISSLPSPAVAFAVCLAVNTPACRTPGPNSQSEVKDDQQHPSRLLPLNLAAGTKVLYEMQLRSANACDPTVGAPWQRAACERKPAPKVVYRAKGMRCGTIDDLHRIKLGTIEDALAETADYKSGITLRYIKEKVGANMVWIMPPFPNNDIINIPHECDNLGSPYAVRDYMHIAGTLGQSCIAKGRDEYSDEPCWGNDSFDRFVQKAHNLGIKVMVDIAFNHFGHDYLLYDYSEYMPVRERIARGEDLARLWDFDATYEDHLLRPTLLDSVDKLNQLAAREPSHRENLAQLKSRCPSLAGKSLVLAYNTWLNALDNERGQFSCDQNSLESRAPGFFMGSNRLDPATHGGQFFSNNWRDVKFLYHRSGNPLKQHEMIRNREYLFRVMNYWVSRGVDGFRLDHATDGDSGLDPHTWHYIISKTNFYAAKRGQEKPIYHAEEFFDQWGMDRVSDLMTEGYVFGINSRGGGMKNTGHVENLINNMGRFPNHSYTLTALETHDEPRLLEGTGFNHWTGAGFWGLGATTRSAPMLLAGQEFGERWGLGFKRSDFLRSRFEGSPTYFEDGDKLRTFYHTMITGRLAQQNRALFGQNFAFLRSRVTNAPDDRIFAQVKWSDDLNVVFTFHNLWESDVDQKFFIPPNVGDAIGLRDDMQYKLIDIIDGMQKGPCRSGRDLKWEFPVSMSRATRAQWLRLETCSGR